VADPATLGVFSGESFMCACPHTLAQKANESGLICSLFLSLSLSLSLFLPQSLSKVKGKNLGLSMSINSKQTKKVWGLAFA
jgi:hypothetical protein